MDKKDILAEVYNDFFGIDKISKENEKLAEEIENLKIDYENLQKNSFLNLNNDDVLGIELNKETNSEEAKPEAQVEKIYTKEEKDELMSNIFERIDNANIDEKSKELLKKIIEYMRKFGEEIEKEYIPFNMCIYSDNDETIKEVLSILNDAGNLFKYIKRGNIKNISMYEIEDVKKVDEIYDANSSIIAFKNINGLNSKEQDFKEKFLYKLNEIINAKSREVLTVLIAKNKENLHSVFEINEEIKNKFDDFEIIGTAPDVQDAYQDIENILMEKMELDDDFKIKLLDYVSTTYPNNDLPYPVYRDDVCKKYYLIKKFHIMKKIRLWRKYSKSLMN